MRILITGATDGIGLETAKKFKELGHEVIVHGRSPDKLEKVKKELGVETFRADFSNVAEVNQLADEVLSNYSEIDVLINNAGVFKTSNPMTKDGFDIRFVVNLFAPFILTKKLLPIIKSQGRIINLSSAAQASVDFDAVEGKRELNDFEAYAQSKLGITMWSRHLANELGEGPVVIAVNPGSLLGTKMVKEGFGTNGNDINIGVNILKALSLDEKHAGDSGKYYDNDNQTFADPQADGLDETKTEKLIALLNRLNNN